MKKMTKKKKIWIGSIAGVVVLLACLGLALHLGKDAPKASAEEVGYKVCFEENGGSLIRDMRLPKGQVLSAESVNSFRLGYSLDGWYTAGDFSGTPWDFANAVTGDMTLYAKWTMEEYTLTVAEDESFTVKVTRGGEEITSGTKVTVNDVLDITTTYGEGYVASAPAASGEKGRFILGKGQLRHIGEDVTVYASLTPRSDVPYTVRYVTDEEEPTTLLTEERTDGVYGGNCNVLSTGKSLYNGKLISNGRIYTPIEESKLADIALDGSTVVDFACTKVNTGNYKFFVQAWPDGMNVKNEEGIVEIDGSEHSSEVFFRPGEYSGYARNWTMTGTVTKAKTGARGYFAIGIKSSDGRIKWFEVFGNNYAVMNGHDNAGDHQVGASYPQNFQFSQAACSYYYGETNNGGGLLNYKITIEDDILKVWFWNNDSRYSEPVLGINVPLTDENFGSFAKNSYYQIGIYDGYVEKEATSKTISNIGISTSNKILEETQYQLHFVTADGTLINFVTKVNYGGKTITETADAEITANNRFYKLAGKSTVTKTIAEDGSTVFEFVYEEYDSNGNFYIGEIVDNAQVDFVNRELSFEETADGYAFFDASAEQSYAKKWEISGTVTKAINNKRGYFAVGVRGGDGKEMWFEIFRDHYSICQDHDTYPNDYFVADYRGKLDFSQAACSYFYAEHQNGGTLLHYKATIENDVLKVWFWNDDSRYDEPVLGINVSLTEAAFGGFAAGGDYQMGIYDRCVATQEVEKTFSDIQVQASEPATQYKIHYTLADGTVIDSFIRSGKPGDTVSFTAESRLELKGRYFRLTDDSKKTATVAGDNSTVITFLYEEYWLESYAIRYTAVTDGTVLQENIGKAEAGTVVTVEPEEKLAIGNQHYRLTGAACLTRVVQEENGTVFVFTYEQYTPEAQFHIDSKTDNTTAEPMEGTMTQDGTSSAEVFFKADAAEVYAPYWELTGTVSKEAVKRAWLSFGVRASNGKEKWFAIDRNTFGICTDVEWNGLSDLGINNANTIFNEPACRYFYDSYDEPLHFKLAIEDDTLKAWFWSDNPVYSEPALALNLKLTEGAYGGFTAGSQYQLGIGDKYMADHQTAKHFTELFAGGSQTPITYTVNYINEAGEILKSVTQSSNVSDRVTVEAPDKITAGGLPYTISGCSKYINTIAQDGSTVIEFTYEEVKSNGNFYISSVSDEAQVDYDAGTVRFDKNTDGYAWFGAAEGADYARKWELTGTIVKDEAHKRDFPGFGVRDADGNVRWFVVHTNLFGVSTEPTWSAVQKLPGVVSGQVDFVQAACSFYYGENQNGGGLLHYRVVIENDRLKAWFWNDDSRYSEPKLGLDIDLTSSTYGGFASGTNYQMGICDLYVESFVHAETFTEITVKAEEIGTQYSIEYILSDGTVLKESTSMAVAGEEVTVTPEQKLAQGDQYYRPLDASAVTQTVAADGSTIFSFVCEVYTPDEAFYVDSKSDSVTTDAIAGVVTVAGTAHSQIVFKANEADTYAKAWEMTGSISKADAKRGYLSFGILADDGTEKWYVLRDENFGIANDAKWSGYKKLALAENVVMTNAAAAMYSEQDNSAPLHFKLVIENDTLKAYFWSGNAGCQESDLALNLDLTSATYGGFTAGSDYQLGIGDRYNASNKTVKTVTGLAVTAKKEEP